MGTEREKKNRIMMMTDKEKNGKKTRGGNARSRANTGSMGSTAREKKTKKKQMMMTKKEKNRKNAGGGRAGRQKKKKQMMTTKNVPLPLLCHPSETCMHCRSGQFSEPFSFLSMHVFGNLWSRQMADSRIFCFQ